MADQQIDELSLKIEVKQNNVAKDIDKISAAIDKLTSSLKGMKELSGVLDKLSNLKLPKNISAATKKVASGTPKLKTEEITPIQSRINNVIGINNETKSAKESAQVFKELASNINKTAAATKGLSQEQDKSQKNTEKHATAWSKLVKSIGRIAFYRAIRTAIKNIAQTWNEGLNNFVQYDEATNKAMSDIKNSFTQVKNTIGVTAGYLMQTLAPVITSLADSVVGLLDNINMAMAKFQGKDYFSKAKKGADDYAASLKKANAQLLSFDTFTTLGSGGQQETSPEDMFAEASVAEGWNDSAETFLSIIELVKTVFNSVKKIIDSLKPFLSSLIGIVNHLIQKITPLITDLLNALVPVIIELIQLVVPILVDLLETLLPVIIDYIGALIKMIIEAVKILAPVIKMLINILKPLFNILSGQVLMMLNQSLIFLEIITPFLEIICDFLEPIAKILESIFDVLKKVFGGISNGIRGFFDGVKSIFGFAGGGVYETGDFFKANENGTTELIASTNTGGSVMNLDQWAAISYSSFYRALSDYDAAQNGGQGSLDINTLGRGIAASSGFINEMNRRNASLKLR